MNAVVRALAVYFFLMILFRISGKRSLAQITMFDFLLLLIISETTQQAMVGEDHSMTNAFLLIATLVGVDILLSLVKEWSPRLEQIMEGVPVILVENGKAIREVMDRNRVDEDDVMMEARKAHGLERLDQIKYAVLERSGGISVIPKREARAEPAP